MSTLSYWHIIDNTQELYSISDKLEVRNNNTGKIRKPQDKFSYILYIHGKPKHFHANKYALKKTYLKARNEKRGKEVLTEEIAIAIKILAKRYTFRELLIMFEVNQAQLAKFCYRPRVKFRQSNHKDKPK